MESPFLEGFKRCGTWGHAGLGSAGGTGGLDNLGGFSNLDKSVLLGPVPFGAVEMLALFSGAAGFHCLSQPCPQAGFWESHGVFHAPFPLFRAHLGLVVWGCG